jgi:hypothetical protein
VEQIFQISPASLNAGRVVVLVTEGVTPRRTTSETALLEGEALSGIGRRLLADGTLQLLT